MALIEFTDKGLYCPAGGFYLDPWKPVQHAIITHAHSDHARPGSVNYLGHVQTKPLLELRLGNNNYQAVEWEQALDINGVSVSLHPAGHIIGSSQVRVENKGEVWVFTGDFKTEDDGISGMFQPVKCHTLITESTFGLPIYRWNPQQEIFQNINDWVCSNRVAGKTSVLIAYSLGKAQRLLQCLPSTGLPIYVHGVVWNVHQALINSGIALPDVQRVTNDIPKSAFKDAVVIAPSGAESSSWMKRFNNPAVGICSGWMQVRGNTRRKNADAGFALSDHADWKGLLEAIDQCGAQKVFTTHGFSSALSRYLNEKGIESAEVKTEYGNDEEVNSNEAEDDKKEPEETIKNS